MGVFGEYGVRADAVGDQERGLLEKGDCDTVLPGSPPSSRTRMQLGLAEAPNPTRIAHKSANLASVTGGGCKSES